MDIRAINAELEDYHTQFLLTRALILAITAPSKEKTDEYLAIAECLAAMLPKRQVAAAKRDADRLLNAD